MVFGKCVVFGNSTDRTINCIVASCLINIVYLTACAFLNDVANDNESIQKSKLTT